MIWFVFEEDHNENVIHVHRDFEDQFVFHREEFLSFLCIDFRDVFDDEFCCIHDERMLRDISRREVEVDNRIC